MNLNVILNTFSREDWHYCAACEAVAPPRAWHCSTCRQVAVRRYPAPTSIASVAVHPQAGAPLHVRRLLRGSLQPPILYPVPGLDLGGRGVLHLPQHRLRVSGGGARLAPRPHEVRVPAADPDVGGGHLLGPGTGVTL